MDSTQVQLNIKESKIALLSKQLISSIVKKFCLRKIIILAEGKIKEQTRYLSKQLNLKIIKTGNPNINIILSGSLENFQVLSFFAGFFITVLKISSNSRGSF